MSSITPESLLDHLMTLPSVLYARLSPDGRWVAFVWYRRHENLDVFVVPTDGSAPPVALTHTPEATEFVDWTPDGRGVLVAEDHNGDERVRLFRVDLDAPGIMHPLTEAHPPYFLRGGQLSPDGRYLYYGANYDFAKGRLIEPTWIYRHDLHTGERYPIARPQKPAWTAPQLNRQGTHILYARKDRHPSGRQFHLVDVQGREDREILNFGDRAKVYARWFPDGERILVLAENLDADPPYQRLGIYHRTTGALRWLLDDPHRLIEGAWVTPEGLIIVDEIRDATHHPVWLEPDTGTEHTFPALEGNLIPLGRAPDGAWIALYYSATHPRDLVRISPHLSPLDPPSSLPLGEGRGEGRAQRPGGWGEGLPSLTRVWDLTPLRPQDLTPAEDFRWRSVDGLEIQGWLYRARPNPKRAIIYIHGGPTSHSENALNAQIQYFVARGFNVLAVNYRGSTGFGLAFREAIKEDGWGGREQADIATGAQALIRAGLAEPGRVGVTGTSYGGYSAWFLITHYPPEVIAAAAPICGMTDLVVDYETTRPDLRPYSEEMMGGSPDEIPEKYRERSPIHFVQNIRGALLIVQGAQDPNVTPENVRAVRQRLEAHGIPYELLVFEDEGHGILKPENQRRLYPALADFFERVLAKP